jgi:hypothetical protein
MTEPILFQRAELYPLPWLEERLAGVMSAKTFLANLGLDCTGRGRIYQNAVWGHEILNAMESTCESNKAPETASMGVLDRNNKGNSKSTGKRGRPPKANLIKISDIN